MDYERLVSELLDILKKQNVDIRKEALGGNGGGFCRVRDKNIFYYDTQASSTELAHKLAEAVVAVCDTQIIYIKPYVREYLEQFE